MARKVDIGNIVQHGLFGWTGYLYSILCEDIGYADVYREDIQDMERKVPLMYLENIRVTVNINKITKTWPEVPSATILAPPSRSK